MKLLSLKGKSRYIYIYKVLFRRRIAEFYHGARCYLIWAEFEPLAELKPRVTRKRPLNYKGFKDGLPSIFAQLATCSDMGYADIKRAVIVSSTYSEIGVGQGEEYIKQLVGEVVVHTDIQGPFSSKVYGILVLPNLRGWGNLGQTSHWIKGSWRFCWGHCSLHIDDMAREGIAVKCISGKGAEKVDDQQNLLTTFSWKWHRMAQRNPKITAEDRNCEVKYRITAWWYYLE